MKNDSMYPNDRFPYQNDRSIYGQNCRYESEMINILRQLFQLTKFLIIHKGKHLVKKEAKFWIKFQNQF